MNFISLNQIRNNTPTVRSKRTVRQIMALPFSLLAFLFAGIAALIAG